MSPEDSRSRHRHAREGYPAKAIYRVGFFVGLFSHYDQILEAASFHER